VVLATNAHLDSADAAMGANVYAGDALDTATGGTLRLKVGTGQIYLTSESAAQLVPSENGTHAKLVRGTIGFSAAASDGIVIETPVGIVRAADGAPKPRLDASGQPVPFKIDYPEKDDQGNFLSHPSAGSVVSMHGFGFMFVQATIAILILVGFESVTAMGAEAKNAKRDVPIAVVASLLIQGGFCYLIEYFAANYAQTNMTAAAASSAPLGDLAVLIGSRALMLSIAVTVVLALTGYRAGSWRPATSRLRPGLPSAFARLGPRPGL